MNDYIKPALHEDPNHFTLHIGTNDITNASKLEELIAEEILELALKLKSEVHEVSVTNVIVRRDKWSATVQKENEHLKELCRKYNVFLIGHCKFIKTRHHNKRGIHLNKKKVQFEVSLLLNMLKVYSTDMITNALTVKFLLQIYMLKGK